MYSVWIIYSILSECYCWQFPEVMFHSTLQSAQFLICWITLAVSGGTGWVIRRTFLSLPAHTYIKYIFHPLLPKPPAGAFWVHILKVRWWQQLLGGRRTRRSRTKEWIYVGEKSEQGEADEGGGSCVCAFVWIWSCVCVHSHDNKDENMHFLAQCAYIRGAAGRGLHNKTFNVRVQWLLFVAGVARCDTHKNSKAKWIRIWEKRWLSQTQWIGGD